jgi:predicted esterase
MFDDREGNAIYTLGWSSGGPPAYAITLNQEFSIQGAFIAMSVFWPHELEPLSRAEGKRFFLLQSPDDRVTKFMFAERAEQALRAAGADVRLHSYPDGHGWQGNVHEMIRLGIRWLEEGI